jgi:hypothetical protein
VVFETKRCCVTASSSQPFDEHDECFAIVAPRQVCWRLVTRSLSMPLGLRVALQHQVQPDTEHIYRALSFFFVGVLYVNLAPTAQLSKARRRSAQVG